MPDNPADPQVDLGVPDFVPKARIIADSIHNGNRLTSMEVKMHRFMLPAFNSHRQFSRNSASSRAIPVDKQLERVINEPAVPVIWAAERKGMQGGPLLPTSEADYARDLWIAARDEAVNSAAKLSMLGVHKSITNRLLEPFMSHTVIVSSTEWDNFFSQRLKPQDGSEPLAQAEIVAAAEAMRAALDGSTPEPLGEDDWHLPYLNQEERSSLSIVDARCVSAARCARVSYLTHDGKRDIGADIHLFRRLAFAKPPHWSPMEHVATPAGPDWAWHKGNFVGWQQLRHIVALLHPQA